MPEIIPGFLETGRLIDGVDITKYIISAKSSDILLIEGAEFKMKELKNGRVLPDGTTPVILEKVLRVQ